jgi:hypothetical protein
MSGVSNGTGGRSPGMPGLVAGPDVAAAEAWIAPARMERGIMSRWT